MTESEFFTGRPLAQGLFRLIVAAQEAIGPASVRITRSQIAFSRRRAFAWVWTPDRYLRGHNIAPLVLSVALPARDGSPRWKEIVEPARGHIMHHLELRDPAELDDEVHGWLRRAWEAAG
jgi:hypothetical protein